LEQIPLFVRAGSILPLGPAVQFAAEKPDAPIELRIYPGADAAYTLHEDDGTSYAYEHGARAAISLRWDERTQTLSIGAREGSFPGLRPHRTFHVTWVRPGRGAGAALEPKPDLVVAYSGPILRLDRPQP
jgi:alpha-D-xyloside xylohydrolase